MQFSPTTFSDAGGAVSDLFSAIGDQYKAQGDLIEQDMYTSDAALATQNAQFTQTSTAIKLAQQSRAQFQSQSETEANVASAGFAQSGSSLDILANNASQGALTQQVLQQQGLITEEGYTEQATAYTDQANAEGVAAKGAETAEIGAGISAAFKGAAALATLVAAPATGGASLAIPAGFGGLF
jgi:hypothetical protein